MAYARQRFSLRCRAGEVASMSLVTPLPTLNHQPENGEN